MTKEESDALYNAYNINDHDITVADIQKFLEKTNSPLAYKNPAIDYDATDRHLSSRSSGWANEAAEKLLGDNFDTLTPAEILYYAAKMNGCNVVWLLATLQKEQDLIEGDYTDSELQNRINFAAGYGKRSGFLQQILNCTNQLSVYRGYGYSFEYAYEKYTPEADNPNAYYSTFMDEYYEEYAGIMDEIMH